MQNSFNECYFGDRWSHKEKHEKGDTRQSHEYLNIDSMRFSHVLINQMKLVYVVEFQCV